MKAETKRRSVGGTIFAITLSWLGIAGVLNAVAWPLMRNSELIRSAPADFIERFPPVLGSWWLSLMALAYGISALLTAGAVWRLSPSAVISYLVWAATAVLVMAALSASAPGVSVAASAVFLVPVLALLTAGWLFTRRLVQG